MTYTHLMATTRPLPPVRQPSLDTARLHRPAPTLAVAIHTGPPRAVPERRQRFTLADVLLFCAATAFIVGSLVLVDAILRAGGQP
jgi:hypothetical protein